jgi:6-phosphogluconate dehydrogenase
MRDRSELDARWMIGLGRMGASMVRRLMRGGHSCVVYDVRADAITPLAKDGATGTASFDEFADALTPLRVAWMMVPAAVVDRTIDELSRFHRGDIIVDGGNSHYIDDIRRANQLATQGIHYVDVGTSGGVWGFERGYYQMIGGEREAVRHLDPLFATLAPAIDSAPRTPGRTDDGTAEHGYLHCGPHEAGHFVKMVHNGIEYGLMAAYAEVWRRGCVIASPLLDLTAQALAADPQLTHFAGRVPDSGEGRWTITAAINEGVPVHVLSAALYERSSSRGEADFADRLLSAMRYEFGGHLERGHPGNA